MPWCFWGMWASHPNTLPISLAAKISFEQVHEGEEKKKTSIKSRNRYLTENDNTILKFEIIT